VKRLKEEAQCGVSSDKENENEDSDILAQYFNPISDLGEEQTTVETRPSERLVSADTVISRAPVEPTRSEKQVSVEPIRSEKHVSVESIRSGKQVSVVPKLQEDDSFADMFEDWEEVGEEVAPPLAAKFNRHKIIEIDDTVNNQLISFSRTTLHPPYPGRPSSRDPGCRPSSTRVTSSTSTAPSTTT